MMFYIGQTKKRYKNVSGQEIQIWIFLQSNFICCLVFMSKRVKRSVKSKGNWSHENFGAVIANFTQVNSLYQGGSVIVAALNTQGTRTVGNFTITIPIGAETPVETYWALVYVPQGTSASNLFGSNGNSEGSLYEPNQFVLASGISDNSAGPIRIRSRMQRKLHSGDNISLVIGHTAGATQPPMRALISYSIKYN